MPGYDFRVSLTLENKNNHDLVVRIPRGSLIEPDAKARTQQSAVVKKDYVFRLNPKEVRPVIIEAECWNQHLSSPQSAPGKITPFSGKVQNTTKVWAVSGRSAAGTLSVPPLTTPSISELVLEVGGTWACEAFKFKVDKVHAADPSAPSRRLKAQIESAGGDPRKLKTILDSDRTLLSLTASDLREWLISSSFLFREDGEIFDFTPLKKFISLFYANKSHDLSSALYLEANELDSLRGQLQYTVSLEKKRELREIIQNKVLTIVDAFPDIDRIYEPSRAA